PCCFLRLLFRTPAACPVKLDDLKCATRFGNLFLSGPAECMRVNDQLCGKFAVTEDLDARKLAANESVSVEQLWCNRLASWKYGEVAKVQDRVFHAEWIVKAALWHAAVQRHLATFKTAAAGIAAT